MADASVFEIVGAAAGGAATAIGSMYKLFVPRREAKAHNELIMGAVSDTIKSFNEERDRQEKWNKEQKEIHEKLKQEYKEKVDEAKIDHNKRIDEQKKAIEDLRVEHNKKLAGIEFSLSKAITRETLDDVMGPMKQDLREIKVLLREKR